MTTIEAITAELAKPMTHAVITRFASGEERQHCTRGANQAENYAIGERRKIGRTFISRNSDLTAGPEVVVTSVEVVSL